MHHNNSLFKSVCKIITFYSGTFHKNAFLPYFKVSYNLVHLVILKQKILKRYNQASLEPVLQPSTATTSLIFRQPTLFIFQQ